MANEAAKRNFQQLSSYLESIGLGALFTVDQSGNPGGWLWNQMKSGIDSPEELLVAVEQTDIWRDRFAVIVEQRKRAAAGDPVQVMTVAQVVEYEKQAANLMRQYGLPSWFYDEASDFNDLILSGMALSEVDARLSGAYNMVANLDPDIRQQFEDFYGVGQSDGALAAYFLDPDRTEAALEKAALASYAGAMAQDFGLNLNREQGETLFMLGRTQAGVAQDLSEMNAQSLLLQEGAGEATDLDEDVVFDAVVRGDAESRRALESRLIRRQSNARATAGGALATQEGLIGSGTAR